MAYKIFNPAASDGKKFFQNLREQKVRYVELTPKSGISPIGRSIRINSCDELNRFLAIWNGADTFIANHPKDVWSVRVRLYADKGVYSGVLRVTTNQGVMFDFDGSPTGWPVISEYQLRRSSPAQIEAVLQSLEGSLDKAKECQR
ncbi:hypothetical protein ACFFJT_21100 [Dyella flava]|uniref:Uncharacterized protein n=1 Tax=Dyella flava TaxID=1920170 RepID=A0ABS2JZY7_9GAMM|nr:hypothetical protein [Dyella flava]MBM7124562.1 hypothetical protein [Dyella flava]